MSVTFTENIFRKLQVGEIMQKQMRMVIEVFLTHQLFIGKMNSVFKCRLKCFPQKKQSM